MCTHLATIEEVGTATVIGEDSFFTLKTKTKSFSTVVFSHNFCSVGWRKECRGPSPICSKTSKIATDCHCAQQNVMADPNCIPELCSNAQTPLFRAASAFVWQLYSTELWCRRVKTGRWNWHFCKPSLHKSFLCSVIHKLLHSSYYCRLLHICFSVLSACIVKSLEVGNCCWILKFH